MNRKYFFVLFVLLIGLVVSACGAPTTSANPADRFAGVWSGTMSFSDNPDHKEDIRITIPVNCKPGGFCGDFGNNTQNCRAALKLVAVRGDVIEYELDLTPTLDDRCLESGGGTLTLQADGTLFREHKTSDLTVSGTLTRK